MEIKNVVVIGGDQAVAPLKVCDLHRFCVREMEGVLDTLRFVILQIENDLSLAVVDDALAKTPSSRLKKSLRSWLAQIAEPP